MSNEYEGYPPDPDDIVASGSQLFVSVVGDDGRCHEVMPWTPGEQIAIHGCCPALTVTAVEVSDYDRTLCRVPLGPLVIPKDATATITLNVQVRRR